jgi:hypothetical protein
VIPWTEIREFLLRPIVFSVVSNVVSFLLGWLIASVRARRVRRKLARLSAARGEAEVVLIVSNRERIRAAVERHLKQLEKDKIPVFEEHRDAPFTHDLSDWYDFVHRISRAVRRIRQLAPTRILFYTNVPVAMAVGLGAILDNGPEVWVHHYFNGIYRVVVILAHETVVPREEVESAIEEERLREFREHQGETDKTQSDPSATS